MQRYKINYSVQTVISSALIVLVSFFYVFSVGTFFEIGVFSLEERDTIHKSFYAFVFEQYLDRIVITAATLAWFATSTFGKTKIVSLLIYGSLAVAAFTTSASFFLNLATFTSLPAIVAFLIYSRISKMKISTNYNLTVAFFAMTGIALGGFSLLVSSLTFFASDVDSIDYAFQIFILVSMVSPALVVFLVASSPIKLVAMESFHKLTFKKIKTELTSHKLNSKIKIIYLISFMFMSIILGLIPHFPIINSGNEFVGADSADYLRWINNLNASDDNQFLNQIFVIQSSGDRPISLLLFFSITKIVNDSTAQVIDHFPLILAPILVLVVFYLTRELTSNDITSLFAAFLTAISFHTLIGVYAGIYANWLAIIIGYSALIFLIRFLRISSKPSYIIFSTLLLLLLFTHVYTWTVLVFFMFIFLGVAYRLKLFETKKIVMIVLILTASVAVDISKSFLTDSVGGFEQDVLIADTKIGSENVFALEKNLEKSIQLFAGGQFSNILILLLCVCWLLMSKNFSISNIFIGVFFSIALLPILFGEDIIQTRILYNIPFQIPAAISLTFFMNRPYGKLVTFSVCILIFAMSIKSVLNFV